MKPRSRTRYIYVIELVFGNTPIAGGTNTGVEDEDFLGGLALLNAQAGLGIAVVIEG
jgi:hypothetical protein